MATTKTYTKAIKLTSYTTCTVTYTVTETETNATIAFTKVAWTNSRSSGLTEATTWMIDVVGSGVSSRPRFPSLSDYGTAAKGKKSWSKTYSNVSATGPKLETAYRAEVNVLARMQNNAGAWSKDADITAPISAWTSYKVTYNANGGSGAPSTQTKWHSKTLQLSSTEPTRTGYHFKGWATTQARANAKNVDYAKGANYTGNAALNLYAVWDEWITGITLDVDTLRVADGTSTTEADEGTWCYGTCAYTVTGVASGTLTLTVSVFPQDTSKTPPEPSIQTSTYTIDKSANSDLTGSIVFRASGCSTETSYTFTVNASCTNTTSGVTQNPVQASNGDVLSTAYFAMDVLGDHYWDSENQTGERPGHGIAFGEPAKWEGFRVAMKPYFGDYPVKDTSDKYALIVGNGESDTARSNAATVSKDGDLYLSNGGKKLLWRGAWYMGANQTITLSEAISEQAFGVVLHWTAYVNNTIQYYDNIYQYIPKHHVALYGGKGIGCFMISSTGSTVGHKYVYVNDSQIAGNSANTGTNTASGITFNNSYWVLVAVIGV